MIGDTIRFIGTIFLFLMAIVVMFTLFSRIKTTDHKTVSDVLAAARVGIRDHLTFSSSLNVALDIYICGAEPCASKNIRIMTESVWEIEKGHIYTIFAEKCEDLVCVTVTEEGNSG